MAKTYKLGSNGDGVRMIQRLLRERGYELTADGDFGPRTLAALKALQHNAGLTADGIAGAKTLAVLADVSITQAPISKHITRKTGRQVRYIAIHYTAGRSRHHRRIRAADAPCAMWRLTIKKGDRHGTRNYSGIIQNPKAERG